MGDLELRWETPPPSKRGRPISSEAEEVLAALQARPGEWVRYCKETTLSVSGAKKRWPGIEAVSRKMPDDKERWIFIMWPPADAEG